MNALLRGSLKWAAFVGLAWAACGAVAFTAHVGRDPARATYLYLLERR